jgi:hypothetical protein
VNDSDDDDRSNAVTMIVMVNNCTHNDEQYRKATQPLQW